MRAAEFFAFARRRHQIYLDRTAGRPEPWTGDPILGRYRFTNVFRELDRTTVWFRENVRDRLAGRPVYEQVLGTILFRTLNRIESGSALFSQGQLHRTPPGWNYIQRAENNQEANWVLYLETALRHAIPKGPWVTGAYIVKTPDGMDKLRGALWIVQEAAKRLPTTLADPAARSSLEGLHRALQSYPFIGGFTGYEIVSDLRHLPILREAPDIMTWAHAGPGAVRGLNRLMGFPVKQGMRQSEALMYMRHLLAEVPKFWPAHDESWPTWEMREIEHTLCEFDKYERVRLGEGTPRGRFR